MNPASRRQQWQDRSTSKKARAFLTGAVYWVPDFRERFAVARTKLEAIGKEVVTPLDPELWDYCFGRGADVWLDVARHQVRALGSCDELWLLDTWKQSSMIRAQIFPLAQTLDIPVHEMGRVEYVAEWVPGSLRP